MEVSWLKNNIKTEKSMDIGFLDLKMEILKDKKGT